VRDQTAVPFLTVGSPWSRGLDEVLCIERRGRGYRVRDAVADLTAFVRLDGELDIESFNRGRVIYAPDHCTPRYPERLGLDGASLLPGSARYSSGTSSSTPRARAPRSRSIGAAMVCSKARFDFAQVQHAVEHGSAEACLNLLKEVGQRRIAMEWARGGASLPVPEQDVGLDEGGNCIVAFSPPPPAQDWTVQISLMVGMAAAEMMLHAEIGVLRIMPEPDQHVFPALPVARPGRWGSPGPLRRCMASCCVRWTARTPDTWR
jgi:exoribonuclease R